MPSPVPGRSLYSRRLGYPHSLLTGCHGFLPHTVDCEIEFGKLWLFQARTDRGGRDITYSVPENSSLLPTLLSQPPITGLSGTLIINNIEQPDSSRSISNKQGVTHREHYDMMVAIYREAEAQMRKGSGDRTDEVVERIAIQFDGY